MNNITTLANATLADNNLLTQSKIPQDFLIALELVSLIQNRDQLTKNVDLDDCDSEDPTTNFEFLKDLESLPDNEVHMVIILRIFSRLLNSFNWKKVLDNDFQNDESLVAYCKDSLFYQVVIELLDYYSDVCNGDRN